MYAVEKAKKFILGRRGQMRRIREACKGVDGILWFHTASYGEFEEIRPVVEQVRGRYPQKKILLTFFSPSGYEALKDTPLADWVFYLPLDTPGNARRFVKAVHPEKAIFSMGEYWLCFLAALRRRKVDTYVISARIPADTPYLKWYARPYRKALRTTYRAIMVQNELSASVMKRIGVPNVIRTGNPRIDRVCDLAATPWKDEIVERWAQGRKVFVAGSTAPGRDDEMVVSLANAHPSDKFLLVPHEPAPEQIRTIRSLLRVPCAQYTQVEAGQVSEEALQAASVLIVDKVGTLSKLYRYGFAAYVGAGFTTDEPHSVIEPAAYGLPVATGPRIKHNPHCVILVERGAGFAFATEAEIGAWYDRLTTDPAYLKQVSDLARSYCEENRGATQATLDALFA